MLLKSAEATIDGLPAATLSWPRRQARRQKRLARRLARDVRVLGPLFAVAAETLVLALAIVAVERAAEPSGDALVDYRPTISSSSTSNVSAAPPRITGAELLLP